MLGGKNASAAARSVEAALAQANAEFDEAAADLSANLVGGVDAHNRAQTEAMLRKTLGVSSAQIVDAPLVAKPLAIARAESTALIKTIPENHFAQVTRAVIANFKGETFEEGSLTARLRALGPITDRRARFIARDQTAKLVSSLNEVRQSGAGITGYIWRTSKDNAVVGAPGNDAKPNALHGDHFSREGKVFLWSKPPSDGHPGQPIGCRCRAEPIVDMDEVLKDAVQL